MNDVPRTATASEISRQQNKMFCFGPPPLIEGEDSQAYDELLLQVSTAVKPADFFEELFVREVVDHTWELFRWRRHQAHLISAQISKRLKSTLEKIIEPKDAVKFIARWQAQDQGTIDLIKETLALNGETLDGIIASQADCLLPSLRSIEDLTARIETRRNATLRELERHRAPLAQRLRGKLTDIEEAEFETIEQRAITEASPAKESST